MEPAAGSWLVRVGIVLVVIGVAVSQGWLRWFGNLPGDITWTGEDGSTTVFIPFMSCLVASAVISVIARFTGSW